MRASPELANLFRWQTHRSTLSGVEPLIKDSVNRIREVGGGLPELAGAAAVVLLIGAGLLYLYAAAVNLRRLMLARCLASNDSLKASSLWAGPQHGIKKERGWLLRTGTLCLGAGILLSAAVTWVLLTG
jgi:hypothetical protein